MDLEFTFIEDHRKRDERPWEPIPLHAPTPVPYVPESVEQDQHDRGEGGCVIIIDMTDYSETRL